MLLVALYAGSLATVGSLILSSPLPYAGAVVASAGSAMTLGAAGVSLVGPVLAVAARISGR